MSIRRLGVVLGGLPEVDSALSTSSVNPIQNQAVANAIGATNGIAGLDANGKVPSAQLPSMDYIPSSDKGAAGGVAELDENGKVPSGELPMALDYTLGAVRIQTGNSPGGLVISQSGNNKGIVSIVKALSSDIDTRNQQCKPIVPNNLDYAVRSVLPNVTVIPAATTEYSLVDASATTNNHSMTYSHVPSAASTYALPSVSAATAVHEIVLTIFFRGYYRSSTDDSGSAYAWKATDGTILYTDTTSITAGTTVAYSDTALTESAGTIALYDSVKTAFALVGSYSFEDADGNAIIPLSTPTIGVGSVVTFLCRWEALLSQWVIMPIPVGTEAVPA